MTTPTESAILKRHDRDHDVETIADALSLSPGHVYSVLRKHRPNRKRKAHKTTSDIPRMIAGLAKQGHKPARVAVALGITRAYVYRHWPT